MSDTDSVYTERNRLVAWLSHLYPSYLTRHPDEDKSWEDDWRWIVCILTSEGQLTWHIHDSDKPMFEHLDVNESHQWDGHTTTEKYARISRIVSAQKSGVWKETVSPEGLVRISTIETPQLFDPKTVRRGKLS